MFGTKDMQRIFEKERRGVRPKAPVPPGLPPWIRGRGRPAASLRASPDAPEIHGASRFGPRLAGGLSPEATAGFKMIGNCSSTGRLKRRREPLQRLGFRGEPR